MVLELASYAVDYYYRSLGDRRLEVKLIDLMISLESLFSLEKDELRLRYSLRAASLLSIEQEAEYSTIFKTIYSLYDRQSKVIHGVTDVKLDEIEIFHFQKCLREAIKRFIHIEMPKKGILKLLDDSVFDQDKKKMLKEIILEAQKKW